MLSSSIKAFVEKQDSLEVIEGLKDSDSGKSTREIEPARECACAVIKADNFSFYYGSKMGVKDISMEIYPCAVTAIIGPSGCGKSTFLRSINRINDLIPNIRVEGKMYVNGRDIYDKQINLVSLRQQVGMVFQKPNPFPKSIYDNIAYGSRIHGIRDKDKLNKIVKKSLEDAALLDEVGDRLGASAMSLSGGQQQRLCIARTLAIEPEIILMDEPCSALDPIATAKIEDLINILKKNYTVVIVTHNMQQAARVSDYTGFFYLGKLIEFGKTKQIFENPKEELTENYMTGRFG
jgi:phosphate transport system ATP-binding protein